MKRGRRGDSTKRESETITATMRETRRGDVTITAIHPVTSLLSPLFRPFLPLSFVAIGLFCNQCGVSM